MKNYPEERAFEIT